MKKLWKSTNVGAVTHTENKHQGYLCIDMIAEKTENKQKTSEKSDD